MHLSFTLDLHEFSALTDSKNDTKKKAKSYFGRRTKEKTTEASALNHDVISHIYQIIEFLGREINVFKEGLFRKTGSISRQEELRKLLNIGADIDFSLGIYSAHDCACVLKSFLAELPEPLLTEAHFSAHCQIAGMCHDDMSPRKKKLMFSHQLKATRLLLLLLPLDNYCLLKYLLLLLNQIQNAREKNKMTSANLAVLFAPHIICPRKMSTQDFTRSLPRVVCCLTFLIENAASIFEPPKELVRDILLYLQETSVEGDIQPKSNNEAVKTMITFCDRTKVDEPGSVDYTTKALTELQLYIENLPNSTRKRKLIKKFQGAKLDPQGSQQQLQMGSTKDPEPVRKHFRSRSVGDAIKKHIWKHSNKRKETFLTKNFSQSTFNMESTNSKSTDSIPCASAKSSSLEL